MTKRVEVPGRFELPDDGFADRQRCTHAQGLARAFTALTLSSASGSEQSRACVERNWSVAESARSLPVPSALPVPRASFQVHPSGAVTPLGHDEPPDQYPRHALTCRWCGARFMGRRDRGHCSVACYDSAYRARNGAAPVPVGPARAPRQPRGIR